MAAKKELTFYIASSWGCRSEIWHIRGGRRCHALCGHEVSMDINQYSHELAQLPFMCLVCKKLYRDLALDPTLALIKAA